jgi:hypothetical protein
MSGDMRYVAKLRDEVNSVVASSQKNSPPLPVSRSTPTWGLRWKAFVQETADRWNIAYVQKTTPPYEVTTFAQRTAAANWHRSLRQHAVRSLYGH